MHLREKAADSIGVAQASEQWWPSLGIIAKGESHASGETMPSAKRTIGDHISHQSGIMTNDSLPRLNLTEPAKIAIWNIKKIFWNGVQGKSLAEIYYGTCPQKIPQSGEEQLGS